jgi:hypothetical protein
VGADAPTPEEDPEALDTGAAPARGATQQDRKARRAVISTALLLLVQSDSVGS